MSRGEVAAAVGALPERRKNEDGDPEREWFGGCGMFVYYDEEDGAIAVECGRQAHLEFDGYGLFEHSALEVMAWALRRDPQLERRDGFISRVLGLSMYAPEVDEDDMDDEERAAPAEGFLVFKPGYYEDEYRRINALRAAEH